MTDVQENKFKITLEGIGLNRVVEIDSIQLAKILPVILPPSNQGALEETPIVEAWGIKPQLSVGEFLNEKNPQTNAQKLTVFALYLRDYSNQENVSSEDLKMQFERAREFIPKNLSRDINQAIGQGWIADSTTTGRFFITSTGEDAVKNKFENSQKKIRKTSSGIKKFAPLLIRSQIKEMDIEPVSAEFGSYWKLETKGDKLLWLLAQVDIKKLEEVNLKELSLLSTKVGDYIPAGNIAALTESHKKEGRIHITKNDSIKVKILAPGILYLKNKIGEE